MSFVYLRRACHFIAYIMLPCGSDCVGAVLFLFVLFFSMYSLSTFLDYELLSSLVPGTRAICLDHDVTWLAAGFNKHLCFCIVCFFSQPLMTICSLVVWQQSQ